VKDGAKYHVGIEGRVWGFVEECEWWACWVRGRLARRKVARDLRMTSFDF
jgi:hypothetical protein